MGIEPKRHGASKPVHMAFREACIAACDWRANFRVTRDNVGPRETTTPVTLDFRSRTRRKDPVVRCRSDTSRADQRQDTVALESEGCTQEALGAPNQRIVGP